MKYLIQLYDGDIPESRIVEMDEHQAEHIVERLTELSSGFGDSNGQLLDYEVTQLSEITYHEYDAMLQELNEEFTSELMNIIINGETHTTRLRWISYEDLVGLAGYKGHPTATYQHNHKGGTLYKGKSVKVEEGIEFNVCHTNSA
jgi:hypothetical protein